MSVDWLENLCKRSNEGIALVRLASRSMSSLVTSSSSSLSVQRGDAKKYAPYVLGGAKGARLYESLCGSAVVVNLSRF